MAKTNSSVIITGETGTGKELVAGAIHYNSPRAGGPFVRVNCAALPEQLLESELFGYEKGAFTGADKLRIGRFEQADGGTIFLDEVADMSLYTQAKVLRVLQEKEFERLGSNETVRTDVRIISATNKNLMELMSRSLFREDLYYRLNVVTIHLPPLRETGRRHRAADPVFSEEVSHGDEQEDPGDRAGRHEVLTGHHWPGNIRELENAMERAVLMAEGDVITTEDLNLFFAGEGPGRDDERIRLPARGSAWRTPSGSFQQALERRAGSRRTRPGCWASPAGPSTTRSRASASPTRAGSRTGRFPGRERAGMGRIRKSRRTEWELPRWFS